MSEQRVYGLSAALLARPRGLTSYGHLVRIAAATTVSYVLAVRFSGSLLPVFAPITTLSVVQASPFSTLGSTVQRVLGTAVGVVGAAAYLRLVPIAWWSVFLAILGALLVAKGLRLALPGQLQIPIAVIFVLALGPTNLSVDVWRVVDVAVGGLVGVLAVLLVPDRPRVAPAVEAVGDVVTSSAEVLRAAAGELQRARPSLAGHERHDFVAASRRLREGITAMRDTLDIAVESQRFNLRRPDHELAVDELAAENTWVWRVVLQLRSLMGALDVLYDRPGPAPLLAREGLADLLRATATLFEARHRDDPAATASVDRELRATLAGAVERVGSRGAAPALDSLAVLGRIAQLRQLVLTGPVLADDLEDDAGQSAGAAPSWRARLRAHREPGGGADAEADVRGR